MNESSPQTKATQEPTWYLKAGRYIQRSAKDYFIGLLLQPWIWATGYIVITGAFIATFYFRNDLGRSVSEATLNGGLSVLNVWAVSLVAIIANYTLSFYSRYKTPKLTPLLFLISLNILLVLFISLIPFFISFFQA